MKHSALRCAKCHKPIRKGQYLSTHTFAVYRGRDEQGRGHLEPWLTVIVHAREECMALDAEVIREARKARRVLVSEKEEA